LGDGARRRRVQATAGPEAFEASSPSPEVLDAVAGLSLRQRAVVVLTYWNDLEPAAVAGLLGPYQEFYLAGRQELAPSAVGLNCPAAGECWLALTWATRPVTPGPRRCTAAPARPGVSPSVGNPFGPGIRPSPNPQTMTIVTVDS
jgi:hypothetical protein